MDKEKYAISRETLEDIMNNGEGSPEDELNVDRSNFGGEPFDHTFNAAEYYNYEVFDLVIKNMLKPEEFLRTYYGRKKKWIGGEMKFDVDNKE